MNDSVNILLAGVGGQGTVLASRLLAQCGINRGVPAHTAETIGMAQRGGCVVSHVRIGATAVSPLIPKGTADLIIGFEPAEAVRCFDYLRPGGAAVVCSRPIRPATSLLSGETYDAGVMLDFLRANTGRLLVFDGNDLAAEKLPAKALNMALLGAAAGGGVLGFTEEEIAAALGGLIQEKHREANLKAVRLGAERARTI